METTPTELDEETTLGKRCLQVRITKTYQDLSGVFSGWLEKCEGMLVVEHDADNKTKRPHCHILLVEPTVKNDQLQKPLRNMNLKGNADFMFSFTVTKGRHKGMPYKRDETSIYLIKGKYEVKLAKGFATEELEQFKSEWINRCAKDATEVQQPKNKDDSEWDYYLTKYELSKQNLTMTGIKRWLRSDCLSRRKPVPRAGDVNRWAYSIYAITNGKDKYEDQEDLETMAELQTVRID